MRYGLVVAVALAGCAHGHDGDPRSNGDGDAGVDAAPPIDAGCGALPCQAIYVAPTGKDTAAGTRDAPVGSLAVAVARAGAATPVVAVFAQAGSYAEAVSVPSGVTIYGGFDASWVRSDMAITEITAASPAVTFSALPAASGLDHVTVRSADAGQRGASSIAVLVTGSPMIELRDVTLLPGKGATGLDGGDGAMGSGGTSGENGGSGA